MSWGLSRVVSKDGLIKRMGKGFWTYFSRIGKDYVTTFSDTAKQIRANPAKFVAVMSGVGAIASVVVSCPHEREYEADFRNASIDLYDTPRCLQNPRSVSHIDERAALISKKMVRHANFFGLLHIVWRDDRPECCRLYSEICPYNHPSSGPVNCSKNGPIRSFFRLFLYETPTGRCPDEVHFFERAKYVLNNRILDIGALGQFWYLKSAMMGTLSESRHEPDLQPASSLQECSTTPPPVQIPDDSEMTEQSNQVSNSNNEDGNDSDEWEVLDETLIYADCVGAVESDLMDHGKSILLVDLDSDNPLIQVSLKSRYCSCKRPV
ncbi:unnamed protein product [Rodentolepis nana]|uniref:Mitochondrial import inner membrane translocase subunit Tim17 family protein n=1 Tax=Rodentolepis nana TaxID=102285 RepID=A0A0R3TEB5_RODNA|nr:unnamed protein product [Rodentolepis nana]